MLTGRGESDEGTHAALFHVSDDHYFLTKAREFCIPVEDVTEVDQDRVDAVIDEKNRCCHVEAQNPGRSVSFDHGHDMSDGDARTYRSDALSGQSDGTLPEKRPWQGVPLMAWKTTTDAPYTACLMCTNLAV
jgi:hypothetical protein